MQHVRHGSRRDLRFWLPVALVCSLLVLGFLLFEVLDMDGSDFPRWPVNAAAKLVDPPQNDGRRGIPTGITAGDVDLPPAVLGTVVGTTRLARVGAPVSRRPAMPAGVRIVLARATLSDGPSAG